MRLNLFVSGPFNAAVGLLLFLKFPALASGSTEHRQVSAYTLPLQTPLEYELEREARLGRIYYLGRKWRFMVPARPGMKNRLLRFIVKSPKEIESWARRERSLFTLSFSRRTAGIFLCTAVELTNDSTPALQFQVQIDGTMHRLPFDRSAWDGSSQFWIYTDLGEGPPTQRAAEPPSLQFLKTLRWRHTVEARFDVKDSTIYVEHYWHEASGVRTHAICVAADDPAVQRGNQPRTRSRPR